MDKIRWIPVEEQPPEEGAVCIVRWGLGFATECLYQGGQFVHAPGAPMAAVPSHWIPWPEGAEPNRYMKGAV